MNIPNMKLPNEHFPDKNKKYTYEDYLTWDFDIPYELIDGIPYPKYGSEPYEVVAMAGTARNHQIVRTELEWQLKSFLKGKTCKLFSENFDVRPDINNESMVVQPDIIVVCDPSKVEERGVKGPPDLVIEVISRTTQKKDKNVKLKLYQRTGVKEYWLVDPRSAFVDVFILEDGKYGLPTSYGYEETIDVQVLEGCTINLKEVFEELIEEEIY